jgi:hypothetical protein
MNVFFTATSVRSASKKEVHTDAVVASRGHWKLGESAGTPISVVQRGDEYDNAHGRPPSVANIRGQAIDGDGACFRQLCNGMERGPTEVKFLSLSSSKWMNVFFTFISGRSASQAAAPTAA